MKHRTKVLIAGLGMISACYIGSGCSRLPMNASVVNVNEAEQQAWEQEEKAGDGYQCWAEINSEQEKGYEVICEKTK